MDMMTDACKHGVIRKLTNENPEWCSPSFVVTRNRQSKDLKNQQQDQTLPFSKRYRVVIDYTRLNKVTVDCPTVLPGLDDELVRLQGYQWFSTIDLKSFYHSIPLTPEASLKCAFSVGAETFTPNYVFEGLKRAVDISTRIGRDLQKDIHTDILAWIDDSAIPSDSTSDMRLFIRQYFINARELGVMINISKSVFCSKQITFLGFIIKADEKGVVTYAPLSQRFKIFEEMSMPKTHTVSVLIFGSAELLLCLCPSVPIPDIAFLCPACQQA